MLSRQREPRSPDTTSAPTRGETPKFSASTIEISQGQSGQLIVRVPYTAERVAKIKSITGRQWHPQGKYWSVPQSQGSVDRLLALFAGESVSLAPPLTPRQGPGARETATPSSAHRLTETAVSLFDRVRDAIRTRHYSLRTERKPTSAGFAGSCCFTSSAIRRKWAPRKCRGS